MRLLQAAAALLFMSFRLEHLWQLKISGSKSEGKVRTPIAAVYCFSSYKNIIVIKTLVFT